MRLGLLSDAHGNVEAFAVAIAVLERLGTDEIIFLGDAIGYLPGDGVLDVIRRRGMQAVLGNHEEMLLRDDVAAGQDDIYRLAETRATMKPENFDLITTWTSSLAIDGARGRLLLLHGSPSDTVRGYVYPDTPLQEFTVPAGTVVFMGNTHRPFIRECNGAKFVNIGSCGLPRDCGNLGAVCIFDNVTLEATILRFDIEAATRSAIARCAAIAPQVLAVFERRGPALGVRV